MPLLSDQCDSALIHLAEDAGRAILNYYGQAETVLEKSDASPLTRADLEAHRIIVNGLESIEPAWPILSEESRALGFEDRMHWETYWLVDPLDGTKEFLKMNGEFTVNIALIHRHEPILGVVHAPALGETFIGKKGAGARKILKDQSSLTLKARPHEMPPYRVVGSRSHPSEGLDAFLSLLGPHEMVGIGSSLKFMRIAEGAADLYPRFGPTSEWDTAAAHVILEASGGSLIDLKGHPIRYNTKASLLNPYFIASGWPDGCWILPHLERLSFR